MRRTASTTALTVLVVLMNVATALAAGDKATICSDNHDASKVGECAKGIFAPNAKAFWWILLVAGLLFMAASRKAGRAVATGVILVVSGIAIYNPGGVGEMMSNLANSIV